MENPASAYPLRTELRMVVPAVLVPWRGAPKMVVSLFAPSMLCLLCVSGCLW